MGIARDISSRKKIIERSKEDEDHIRKIFSSDLVPMALWTRTGGIIDTNESFLKMIGYTRSEIKGGKVLWSEITPPQYRERDLKAVDEVERLGFCMPYEKVYYHKDGHEVPILIGSGSFDRTTGTGILFSIDLTERKSMEEKLRQSEEHIRSLFETMVLGVIYQDISGRIIDANPAAEHILGLTINQMQGLTSTDPSWRAIHEDGSDFPGETHPSLVALRTGEIISNTVMGVYHPEEKKHVWINITAVPKFRPGESKPYQVYTTFEDITERKLAEERLRASEEKYKVLIESLDNAVAVINADGRFQYVNNIAAKQMGQSPEMLAGKSLYDLFDKPDADRQMESVHKAIREIKMLTFENQISSASGQRWFKPRSFQFIMREERQHRPW